MLLKRLHAREAPIADVASWLWASGATRGDLVDLGEPGLVLFTVADEQVSGTDAAFEAAWPAGTRPRYGAVIVSLTNRGRYLTRTRIIPEDRALHWLVDRQGKCPLRQLLQVDGVDRDVLLNLDDARLIKVYTSANGGNSPVSYEEATAHGRMFGVQIRITDAGRDLVAT
jgi:hypothetical protein